MYLTVLPELVFDLYLTDIPELVLDLYLTDIPEQFIINTTTSVENGTTVQHFFLILVEAVDADIYTNQNKNDNWRNRPQRYDSV